MDINENNAPLLPWFGHFMKMKQTRNRFGSAPKKTSSPANNYILTATEQTSLLNGTYPNYELGSTSQQWVAPTISGAPFNAAGMPGIPPGVAGGPVNILGPIQDGRRQTTGGWGVTVGLNVRNYINTTTGVSRSTVGAWVGALTLGWAAGAAPAPFGPQVLAQNYLPGQNCLAPGQPGMIQNISTQPMLYMQTTVTINSVTMNIEGGTITPAHRVYANNITTDMNNLLNTFNAFGITINRPTPLVMGFATNTPVAQNDATVLTHPQDFQVIMNVTIQTVPMMFNNTTTTFTSPWLYGYTPPAGGAGGVVNIVPPMPNFLINNPVQR